MTATPTASESADADSYKSFVDKNFPTVYRFAFCMSLAHESAAALTESAFSQAQSARRSDVNYPFDRRGLLATAHHEWQASVLHAGEGAGDEVAPFVDSVIESKDIAELDQGEVLTVLHGMKEELRLVLSLFYFEQMSPGEIAAILETPPELVFTRLAEAKMVLRQRLEISRRRLADTARPRVSETKSRPRG